MRVIRPVEHADIAALMQLAGKTGGGLTSLLANEATLAARIERALKTWSGELPKGEQGYRTMVTGYMSFSKKWGVGSKKGKYITGSRLLMGWKMRQKRL